MQIQSIAECSLGAFCNTFDLHYAKISLDKTNNFMSFVEWPLIACVHHIFNLMTMGQFSSSLLHLNCQIQANRQALLYTIKHNGYPIWEVKKNNFPTDRPIPVKQVRLRGNKNIFKVGLIYLIKWTLWSKLSPTLQGWCTKISNWAGLLKSIRINIWSN